MLAQIKKKKSTDKNRIRVDTMSIQKYSKQLMDLMHSADSGGGEAACLFNPESFGAYRKREVGKAKPRSHCNLRRFAYQFLRLGALASEGKVQMNIARVALYSPHFANLHAGAVNKLAKLVWRAVRGGMEAAHGCLGVIQGYLHIMLYAPRFS